MRALSGEIQLAHFVQLSHSAAGQNRTCRQHRIQAFGGFVDFFGLLQPVGDFAGLERLARRAVCGKVMVVRRKTLNLPSAEGITKSLMSN